MNLETDRRFAGSGDIRHIHDILSNPRQCAILHRLQKHDGQVSVETALEWDDASNAGMSGDGTNAGHSGSQRSDLHELAQFGLLEYDPIDEVVWVPDEVAYTITAPERSDGDGST